MRPVVLSPVLLHAEIKSLSPVTPDPLALTHDQLGEGPFWDDRRARAAARRHHGAASPALEPGGRGRLARRDDGEVGAVAPARAGAGRSWPRATRLLLDDGDGARRTWRASRTIRPTTASTTAGATRPGRLWAGTMSKSRRPGRPRSTGWRRAASSSWSSRHDDLERPRLEPRRATGCTSSTAPRSGSTCSTSTDATGAIANRRPFAEIDPADGLPDGLTVDAEGGVWVCLFGGGALRRYDADGALDAVVVLPVTNPTSPTFGGPELRTLYVTSARHRLSDEQLAVEPLAGAVLALEPGVAGLPGNYFAG